MKALHYIAAYLFPRGDATGDDGETGAFVCECGATRSGAQATRCPRAKS